MTRKLILESRMNKSWVFLLLVYLLTSCAHGLENVKQLPGKEPVAFGRIKAIEEGQPVDWGGRIKLTGPSGRVYIIPDTDPPIPYDHHLLEDGSFYWQLPPGGYMITEFWLCCWVKRAIFAHFFIPPELRSPIYIGTLTIRWEEDRYTFEVEDEYDQAFQKLEHRFPEVKGPITKRLMHLELP